MAQDTITLVWAMPGPSFSVTIYLGSSFLWQLSIFYIILDTGFNFTYGIPFSVKKLIGTWTFLPHTRAPDYRHFTGNNVVFCVCLAATTKELTARIQLLVGNFPSLSFTRPLACPLLIAVDRSMLRQPCIGSCKAGCTPQARANCLVTSLCCEPTPSDKCFQFNSSWF
jgi:hypothetical protein